MPALQVNLPPKPAATVPRRKLPLSFSLLSFLLATGLILAVVSHVRTSLLLENYREKSDELEIESPERIHVRRMKYSNHCIWRWRVFLPEGRHFYLNAATKGVRDGKLPPAEQRRLFDAAGQVIVDVYARDMGLAGIYDVTIMTGGEGPGSGSVTTRAATLQPTLGSYLLGFEELAQDRTLSFAAGEPVVLLRGWNTGTREQVPQDTASEPGIILWIDDGP
jgi:hypothetical protein